MPIINQIVKGGGTTPTGTLSITQNGVYNVTNYASANVNVSGGGGGTPQPNLKKHIVNGLLFADGSEMIDLSGATQIGDYALCYAYVGTDVVPTVAFTNSIQVGQYSMQYMFQNAHFIDPDVDLSGITSVGSYGCTYMFADSDVETVDISGITQLGTYALRNMFIGCTHLTSVNMFNVRELTNSQCCYNMFDSSDIASADLSGTEVINGSQVCNQMFYNCGALTSADVSYIRTINGSSAVSRMFANTGLTSISWDSLQSVNSFGSQSSSFIFNLCSNLLEIHFPSNMQSAIEALAGFSAQWGASNATVYFDLPASYTLTGADGVDYVRNPHHDTADALAWFATGDTDRVPYYTDRTLGDPSVGETIYSDDTLSTVETTIDSVA